MNKTRTFLIYLTVAALLASGLAGCKSADSNENGPSEPAAALNTDPGVFASYQAVPVDVTPSVKPYRVAAGLSNVTNKDRFAFTKEAEQMLVKNGFIVVPSQSSEFFFTYEMNRYDTIPNFITTDSMLHNYHLYFSYLLRTLEKNSLRGELDLLSKSMLKKSEAQYKDLEGTDWEAAAKRNVGFFSVAARLLDPKTEIPAYVKETAEAELKLIAAQQETFAPSPVMNMGEEAAGTDTLKEDYTQYIPRGHYAKSDDMKSYFQAMMWYGRMTFRAASEDETRSAALITLMLSDKEDYDHWNRIYAPTNFFVGKSDDLGFSQYYDLIKSTYGKVPSINKITTDTKAWNTFLLGIKKLDPPAINSIPIYDKNIQPDRDKAIVGFRFMGQRFTLDAEVFQRLVYRDVEENSKGERRMLPKGLDIPAAMGSEEAYSLLKGMGAADYKNYPENMEKLQNTIAGLDTKTKTQNLYWSWLYMLEPLTEAKGEGYPSFMQSQAWTRKQLETYLSSWTELKHDTILYSKQTYAEMGGGEEAQDDRGYVEPNPEVYARLAALCQMTIDGLTNQGLVTETSLDPLQELHDLALQLKTISEKELTEKPLTDQEYDLIRSYGGQLEHFWLEALKDQGVDAPSLAADNPAALVADVATDPSGEVLEEGIGHVNEIYAVVPVDGKLRIASGMVYSYYEFPWPSQDRLTDEKWKAMLEDGTEPAQPDWTKLYTGPKESMQW